jgi:hypothetical protein
MNIKQGWCDLFYKNELLERIVATHSTQSFFFYSNHIYGGPMHLKYLFLIIVVGFSMNLSASTIGEINYLIKYFETSDCQYERNGEMYNGIEAAEHITSKYNYFKDKIDSTEDFTKYSATRSEISGKYYMIHCDGHAPAKIQSWLTQELQRYRSARQQ